MKFAVQLSSNVAIFFDRRLVMDSTSDTIGVQSFNDIEHYLVNFNKEISEDADDHEQSYALPSSGTGTVENGGNLYSDPTSIYHSSCDDATNVSRKIGHTSLESSVSTCNSSVMPNVSTSCFDLDTGPDGLAPHLLALQGAPVGVATRVMEDNLTEDMLPTTTDLSQQNSNDNNDDRYRTVTIVPSDDNQTGQVSYVLIVSQPDGKGDDADVDTDLSIYDFKEEKAGHDPLPLKQEDEPPKKYRRHSSVCINVI